VALPRCSTAAPPLYRSDPQRAAACFRLADRPILPPEAIGAVLGGDREREAPVVAAAEG
jgi:hypothetical protein